jgi:acetyl esterase/lipase
MPAFNTLSTLLIHSFGCVLASLILVQSPIAAELPEERSLWKDGARKNIIHYEDAELERENVPPAGSPSGLNRVFRNVTEATFTIHRPDPEKVNGVGLVICPGGGYSDVWLDREGHDLAIRLKEHGVTSLVLKYRTNSGGLHDKRAFPWEIYLPEVVADAHQALRTLRLQAEELKIDPARIGICGFSAGGHLALSAVLHAADTDAKGRPDFAGLLYPWIGGPPLKIPDGIPFPPTFIMNAADDKVTPADQCTEYFLKLLKAGTKIELHIYSKGSHGFDLATGRAESAALWPESFVAWLKDTELAKD